MLLFHYHRLLCKNLLSGRVLWVFTCRFYNMVKLLSFLVSSHVTLIQYILIPVFNVYSSRVFLHTFKIVWTHTLYHVAMHIILLSILLHTLLIYLPIYAASHSFTINMTAVPVYQATRCHVPQRSNLQNQSRGNSEFLTLPAGLLAAVICIVVNWTQWHEGMYESGLVILHIRNLESKWSFSDQLHVPAHLSQ